MRRVAPHAEAGRLITFGIVPTAPETGYGYIKAGAPLDESGVCAVERFVEKPDTATAQRYLDSGAHYWNSGMFMFRASAFLAELERFAPAMLAACQQALTTGRADTDFLWLDRKAFAACPQDSIDYAVMEKTEQAVVMPLAVGWNDVGSWSALWDVGAHDSDGNIRRGDVITVDTHDTYVDATTRLVATVGVETADAVLVARKGRVQEVKAVVDQPAILILAISPVLGYAGAGSIWGMNVSPACGSRTGTTRPGLKLSSIKVIKSSQLAKHK